MAGIQYMSRFTLKYNYAMDVQIYFANTFIDEQATCFLKYM